MGLQVRSQLSCTSLGQGSDKIVYAGVGKDVFCQRHYVGTGEPHSLFFLRELTDLAQWSEDVAPTVAFNFRKIRKGNVTMKVWDVAGAFCVSVSGMNFLTFCPAGQPKFRSMWERYCNGVDAIVCVDQFFYYPS